MQHTGKLLGSMMILGMAGCAQPVPAVRDTGTMAYPAPAATGTMNRVSTPGTTDTGNMAYPAPVAGSSTLRAAPTARDTGSMAIPPSSQGNLRTGY